MKKDLAFFIEELSKTDEMWRANYYLRCMKKAPHGGVFYTFEPNTFLKRYPFRLWVFMSISPNEIPCFLRSVVERAKIIYADCIDLDIEELLQYCYNQDNWYAGIRTLTIKEEYKHNGEFLICSVIQNNQKISDYFEFDLNQLLYVLILRIVEDDFICINSVKEICNKEQLLLPVNKYNLTKIESCRFERQGFKLDDKYYLYNIFIDTSIGGPSGQCPAVFEIIQQIQSYDLYMRCDNCLAVPYFDKVTTASMDFQKFRGLTISFSNIQKIISKEITVHYNPTSQHKILLIVKPDCKELKNFFHIEVEELWAPSSIKDELVMAHYIHAIYCPDKKAFIHIDFSVNQYTATVYKDKYQESINETGIPIDKYADEHYKVWCVESDNISIDIWGKLVCATLSTPFRDLFVETYKL